MPVITNYTIPKIRIQKLNLLTFFCKPGQQVQERELQLHTHSRIFSRKKNKSSSPDRSMTDKKRAKLACDVEDNKDSDYEEWEPNDRANLCMVMHDNRHDWFCIVGIMLLPRGMMAQVLACMAFYSTLHGDEWEVDKNWYFPTFAQRRAEHFHDTWLVQF